MILGMAPYPEWRLEGAQAAALVRSTAPAFEYPKSQQWRANSVRPPKWPTFGLNHSKIPKTAPQHSARSPSSLEARLGRKKYTHLFRRRDETTGDTSNELTMETFLTSFDISGRPSLTPFSMPFILVNSPSREDLLFRMCFRGAGGA